MIARDLVIPAPLPEELDRGYLGAVLQINGLRALTMKDAAREIRKYCCAPDSGSVDTTLQLLAGLAGCTLSDLVAQHSLLPWRQIFIRGATRSKRGGEPNRIAADAVKLLRPGAAFCPACAAEDVGFHGRAYWRRGHQLPGATACDVHDVSLIRVENDEAFLKSPSAFAQQMRAVGTARTSLIRRFNELLWELGASRAIVDEGLLAQRLLSNLRSPAFEVDRAQLRFDAELASESMRAWLAEVAPPLAGREKPVEFMVDRLIRHQRLSSLGSYLLFVCLLAESSEQAWQWLRACEPNGRARRAPVSKCTPLSADELMRAYVDAEGRHKRAARVLGVPLPTLRKKLLLMGLPPLNDEELHAAWLFLKEGYSIAESARTVGISCARLEKVLRVAALPLANVLARIRNPRAMLGGRGSVAAREFDLSPAARAGRRDPVKTPRVEGVPPA